MRDFQRSKVYEWERISFPAFKEEMQLFECKELASALYGKRVKVKDGRGTRSACAYPNRYPTISLPRWARNRIVVAHEVAHLYIRSEWRQGNLPPHGSTFMRIYIGLLCDKMELYEYDELEQSARDFGLKVQPR